MKNQYLFKVNTNQKSLPQIKEEEKRDVAKGKRLGRIEMKIRGKQEKRQLTLQGNFTLKMPGLCCGIGKKTTLISK